MPRKPTPWWGPDFVSQVRPALEPALLALGFVTHLIVQGARNSRDWGFPCVVYLHGMLFFVAVWDPFDTLLNLKLGPRYYMNDCYRRLIVHINLAFYLEALGLPNRMAPHKEYMQTGSDWSALWAQTFEVVRETLPTIVAQYDELLPKVEVIARRRLPNLVLLEPWKDGDGEG